MGSSSEECQQVATPSSDNQADLVKHVALQAALGSVGDSPGMLSEDLDSTDSFEDQRCVFEVELDKDDNGLGLTVAGYICEKESLCGIFVKKVVEGSVAEVQGKILPNDQVIEVSSVF